MAQLVRRERLLQARGRGGREDLAAALVGDRDDPLVELLAVHQDLERSTGVGAKKQVTTGLFAFYGGSSGLEASTCRGAF